MTKKKIKIVTNFDYELTSQGMEHNNEPSMTVPDDSISIKEILQRSLQGIGSDSHVRNQWYSPDVSWEDEDYEKLATLDPAELEEIALENEEFQKRVKAVLDEKEKEKAEPDPEPEPEKEKPDPQESPKKD